MVPKNLCRSARTSHLGRLKMHQCSHLESDVLPKHRIVEETSRTSAALEVVFDRLRTFIPELSVSLQRQRNAALPIHRLPPELLELIFKNYLSKSLRIKRFYERKRGLRFRELNVLRYVCSRWCEIVDAAAKLWTTLDLYDDPRVVDLFVQKSREAPLRIVCSDGEDNEVPRLPAMCRWRTLSAEESVFQKSQLRCFSAEELPMLEELEIKTMLLGGPYLINLPNLRSLHCFGTHFLFVSTGQLNQLTNLELNLSALRMTTFLTLLVGTPALQSLRVQSYRYQIKTDDDSDDEWEEEYEQGRKLLPPFSPLPQLRQVDLFGRRGYPLLHILEGLKVSRLSSVSIRYDITPEFGLGYEENIERYLRGLMDYLSLVQEEKLQVVLNLDQAVLVLKANTRLTIQVEKCQEWGTKWQDWVASGTLQPILRHPSVTSSLHAEHIDLPEDPARFITLARSLPHLTQVSLAIDPETALGDGFPFVQSLLETSATRDSSSWLCPELGILRLRDNRWLTLTVPHGVAERVKALIRARDGGVPSSNRTFVVLVHETLQSHEAWSGIHLLQCEDDAEWYRVVP